MIYSKARQFIMRNARPLDLARWHYHFENGSREVVLHALSSYQNEDGGFGNGLEPDYWNPNSTPIQTWAATEILYELAINDRQHPIIEKVLAYLASEEDFNGKYWKNTVNSNNDYPHAPWWHDTASNTLSYNPTACLAGFIIRYAQKNSNQYQHGCKLAGEALTYLCENSPLNDMHLLSCYIRLVEYIEGANATHLFNLTEAKQQLLLGLKATLTQNHAEWADTYACRPSQFLNSRDSTFYEANKALVEYECDFILKTQLPDGSWKIPWSWADYPQEWAISQNWWKAHAIIENLVFLRNFEHL
ncbi:Prenyltransferase and squalene oxidase repeat-containing protein [Amphibacillus marinus]|uniref:Prenyltransferase and squalene oxidase repeat-containing protein n=1 Tax=Amphibacillus marinus TaxID=872970 RepID=A0A1H8TKZ5_9BACI|nr:prenyltransferase/squalene oxidase repeat-containing protein [Amphibacillus marinus]SEO91501.1 Prenyltransferase and squalene oxidase repeat-containing protein [Amphibacillus marinus]